MTPIKRLSSLLLAAATVALAAMSLPGSAQAAGGLKLCIDDGYGNLCISRTSYDTSFGNDKICRKSKQDWQLGTGCGGFSQTSTFDDKTSSVSNSYGRWFKLWEDKNYGGKSICVGPNADDADIGNNTRLEDDISSIKIQGTSKPSGCNWTID